MILVIFSRSWTRTSSIIIEVHRLSSCHCPHLNYANSTESNVARQTFLSTEFSTRDHLTPLSLIVLNELRPGDALNHLKEKHLDDIQFPVRFNIFIEPTVVVLLGSFPLRLSVQFQLVLIKISRKNISCRNDEI